MIPERGGHAEFDILVSVMVSHVPFLHILEVLDLEVASEVEPVMHRVIEDLSEKETRRES